MTATDGPAQDRPQDETASLPVPASSAEPAVPNDSAESDHPEQMRVRRAKYDRLIAAGIQPYLVSYPRSVTAGQLHDRFAGLAADTATGERVAVVGRVVFKRDTGKLCFATIRDGGVDLQVMLSRDQVGVDVLAAWKADVDLGDHIGVTGEVISSRRGELSVLAVSFAITAKALRPPPVAHRPLSEESRVRQRHVDLWVRPEARAMAYTRAAVIHSLRSTLDGRGFLEVETPMLHSVQGGAAARPFATHLNAFDLPVYLRIATELHLKRLVIGGLEQVYELGRTFRNEGIDSTHSPEFTELEAYQAYGDYDTMAELMRALVLEAADTIGKKVVPDGRGGELDLTEPWQQATVHDLVSHALGEQVTADTDLASLRIHADRCHVAVRPDWAAGDVVLELYEKLVEHTLLTPTFVRDYPAEVRPLARPHRADPRLAEAWDLVIAGVELGPAYSELVDPVIQRERLTEQSLRAARGDLEAMQVDEDFLHALEAGMPPSGGLGLGVDRLVMLLAGVGIRETILFPLLRPGT